MNPAKRESLLQRARGALSAELAGLAGAAAATAPRAFAREHRPWLGVALALAAFLYYGWLGAGVAEGRVLEAYNLVFDYDPSRYVLLWTGERAEWDAETNGAEYQVRHPFLLALRPALRMLAATGIERRLVCTLFVAACGAGAVLCAYLFLRVHGAGLPESALLTVLFAASSTQLAHSTIVESYAPAALALAATWLLVRLRLGAPAARARSRFLLAVASFGVTSTNLFPTLLAEAALWRAKLGWLAGTLRTAAFGLVLGATLLLVAWGSGALRLEGEGFHPVRILKAARYAGHFDGDVPPAGLDRIAETFLGYAFVAPRFSAVPIEGAEPMLDYRAFDYPPAARVAVLAWLLCCAAGAAASVWRAEVRWLGVALLLGIAFHFALYSRYQFRQSLFLGSSLPHFAVFALQAELARRCAAAPRPLRAAVLAAAAVGVAVLAWNNHARMLELVRTFAV